MVITSYIFKLHSRDSHIFRYYRLEVRVRGTDWGKARSHSTKVGPPAHGTWGGVYAYMGGGICMAGHSTKVGPPAHGTPL